MQLALFGLGAAFLSVAVMASNKSSVHPVDFTEYNAVSIDHGLREETRMSRNGRLVFLNAATPEGRRTLLAKMRTKGVLMQQPHFRLVSTTSTCTTGLSYGSYSVNYYSSRLSVTCDPSVQITATISVEAAPGAQPHGGDYYFTAMGSLNAYVTKQCDAGSGNSCQDKPTGIQEPYDWRIQQTWDASDGESGYMCFVGSSYPDQGSCQIND